MGIRPITHTDGFVIPQEGFEAASQAFKAGAVLVASSGLAAEAGADPTAIVGVSVHIASGTTSAEMTYVPALPGTVFEGTLSGTLAATDMWAEYGITKDPTTGLWQLDRAKTGASARAFVIGFIDPVGTTGGARVRFVFTLTDTIYEAS